MSAALKAALPDVSRETRARLEIIESQLRKWQPRINLVAPSTMADIRARHIDDSLQLLPLAPLARRWIDLGSGGGFPGLVVAAMLAERDPSAEAMLVESNGKKCAFLRETARLAGLPVRVIHERIEIAVGRDMGPFDAISARALAPLERLLEFSEPIVARGAIGIFPKGEDVDDELEQAIRAWHLDFDLIQSVTERKARIVRVRSAVRR